MANIENLSQRVMIIALFIFCAFSFVIFWQVQNNVSDKMISNSLMGDSFNNLTTNLQSMQDSAEAQKNAFDNDNPVVGALSLIFTSITSAGKVFGSMVIGVYDIFVNIPIVLFGVNPIIFSVLTTILIFSIIFGLWLLYKMGGVG